MLRKAFYFLTAFLFLGAVISCVATAQNDKEKEAIVAARAWLKLIDAGEYIQSWKESAGVLRTAVTQDTWVQAMKNNREPFGALVSRNVKVSKYVTELPGAPKGEYVVIQFETMFKNRKSIIVEKVTPMLEKDKKWRVSGYFMQ